MVLSPHLDDAVFSCFGALRGATVVTFCAGVPLEGGAPSPFDLLSGFRTGKEAMEARRREDRAVAREVGFGARHLDCLDCAYGGDEHLALMVDRTLEELEPDEQVLGPLGLHHPDHERVAEAFVAHARREHLNAWVYEELPYAYLWPQEVEAALERVRPADPTTLLPLPGKRQAVMGYASQITEATHMDEILSPERYYKL